MDMVPESSFLYLWQLLYCLVSSDFGDGGACLGAVVGLCQEHAGHKSAHGVGEAQLLCEQAGARHRQQAQSHKRLVAARLRNLSRAHFKLPKSLITFKKICNF